MNKLSLREFLISTTLVALILAFRPMTVSAGVDKDAEFVVVKNVMFLICDDLKASVLSCYGDKVCKTPNIDKLAKSGMVFNRAYCQGTWCAPSRTSFMHSR